MKITVQEFEGELPENEPYTIIETWDELDPDVIRRYLVVGLEPSSSLTALNDALADYISGGAAEGDGWQLVQEGQVGPFRIGICRTDRGHLGRIVVNVAQP